jgi:hypothetical protein
LLSAAIFHHKVGWFGERSRVLYKNLKLNIESLQKNKEILTPLEKTTLYMKEQVHNGLDFFLSFNQLKDKTLGKILGPFKKQTDKVIDYFKKAAVKTTGDKYIKLLKSGDKLEKNMQKLAQSMKNDGFNDEAKELEQIMKNNKIKSSIKDNLVGGYKNRVDKTEEILKEMAAGYDDMIKGNIPQSKKVKEITKEIPDSVKEIGGIYKGLREEVTKNSRQNLMKPTEETVKHIDDLQNFLTKLQNNPKMSQTVLKDINQVSKETNKLSTNVKKAANFEIDQLTNRLLDLDFDGGILEIASPLVATGLLANELRKSESNEERKSKLISLGIPLLGGLGTWYYSAVIKCMSAGQSLFFSLATGGLLTKTGKILNDKIQEKE